MAANLAGFPPLATNLTEFGALYFASQQVRSLPNCDNTALWDTGFCNVTAQPCQRASNLVSQLNLTEKIESLKLYLPGSERLQLPPFVLWNEGLHGLASSVGVFFDANGTWNYATSFPMPILLGAAFDDELVYDVASTISTEARAYGNNGRAGFDLWTPNVNPFRDPRWGRGPETPGEDPFHVASYALAFTSGMEGPTDSPFKKIIATCKHAAAYDVDSWEGIDRYHFDANVSIQELAEYYMPPFEACARDAKVGSLMCSYNEINGVPTCADPWLLQALIREHWGWDDPAYYVTSDCFALDQIFVSHNYTDTAAEAAAIALQAGTDTDCGIFYSTYLPDALNQGLISEADIDRSLTRVFTSIVNLGYFDPPENQPYRSIGWSSVNTIQSQALAYKAATAGITLLKNDQDALPLQVPGDGRKLSVALFGDWANATVQMQGNYYGPAPYLHSPLYGLQRIPNVLVKFFPELNISASALAAANASDIIIYIGGIDQTVEAESLDRTTIEWNATQVSLIASLASLNRPFILVQTGGGQLDDTQFLADPGVSAILWAGYPGQDGGSAIADVMFGQVAPAGRLSVTQYPANYVSVPMTDMNLRPDAEGNLGRTYKWYTGTPVLPFGFGLHYTQFTAELNLSGMLSWNTSELVGKCASVTPIDACVVGTLVIQVTNSGQRQSDYSVLAFVNGSYGPLPRPNKELVAYTRVRDLNPSEQREVQLSITLARLARWDETGCRVLYPGEYRIAIDTDPELTTASFNLVGEPQVLESWPTPTGSRQWKRSVKL